MSTIAIPKLKRVLPGHAWTDSFGKITYLKGVVDYASSRILWILTDSKIYSRQPLIGDTYIYVCLRCPCTVYEQELMMMRQDAIDSNRMPGPPKCPFCSGSIERLRKGDKVRLHFRFARDASSAAWWGERFDW